MCTKNVIFWGRPLYESGSPCPNVMAQNWPIIFLHYFTTGSKGCESFPPNVAYSHSLVSLTQVLFSAIIPLHVLHKISGIKILVSI